MLPSVFLNKLLNFLGIGLTLYALANFYAWVSKDSIIKHTKRCKYCRKWVSEKVYILGMISASGSSTNSTTGTTLCKLYQLAGWTRRCSPLNSYFHGNFQLFLPRPSTGQVYATLSGFDEAHKKAQNICKSDTADFGAPHWNGSVSSALL